MKKLLIFGFLIFFIHFFLFRGLFTSLDSYILENTSGNPILIALEVIVTIIICLIIFIIVFIEKVVETNLKYIYIFILYLHCIFHFCCDAFYEYNLFNDSKSFSISSIIIILIYFIFELFLTFYIVNKLYQSKDHE